MANNLKQITTDRGDKHNLGNIETAAVKAVEQGINAFSATHQEGIRRNTQLLVDGGGATSYTALTAAQSGLILLVPGLTGGTHDITLPSCADAVGSTYTFVATATVAQDFDVLGAASEKILGAVPKGDGDNLAASDANDSVGFDANAVIGSRFSVTCISATAGVAWIAHDILDGIAANTGGINLK
jgi:hypothetical protein